MAKKNMRSLRDEDPEKYEEIKLADTAELKVSWLYQLSKKIHN